MHLSIDIWYLIFKIQLDDKVALSSFSSCRRFHDFSFGLCSAYGDLKPQWTQTTWLITGTHENVDSLAGEEKWCGSDCCCCWSHSTSTRLLNPPSSPLPTAWRYPFQNMNSIAFGVKFHASIIQWISVLIHWLGFVGKSVYFKYAICSIIWQ